MQKSFVPRIPGLQFEALYGYGGVADATGSAQPHGFGAAYANGPLSLAAGYGYARCGRYSVGALRFGLAYSNTQYANDAFSTFHQTAKFSSGSAFLNDQSNPGGAYSCSKRTDVYALAGDRKASVAAQPPIGGFRVNPGTDNQALVLVGIRHKFQGALLASAGRRGIVDNASSIPRGECI